MLMFLFAFSGNPGRPVEFSQGFFSFLFQSVVPPGSSHRVSDSIAYVTVLVHYVKVYLLWDETGSFSSFLKEARAMIIGGVS